MGLGGGGTAGHTARVRGGTRGRSVHAWLNTCIKLNKYVPKIILQILRSIKKCCFKN